MNKIWNVMPEAPREFIEQFPEFLKVILQLLYNRNIKTQKEIDEFFNPDYEQDLHDPYLYKGMREAVLRIKEAINKKEKIVVYGDYDADGVSASVILHTIFKELGADFEVYIPDRHKDGYGLTVNMVGEFAEQKVDLIITVDCGITSVKEVELANKNGIDVIITDHHLPKDKLPPAFATINAMQKDDTYPFKWLCGGAVAFKTVQAILKCESVGIDWEVVQNIKPGFEKWLLDLVALCTITDLVPLVGENRTLAKYGFLVMAQTRRKGLKELMRLAGIEPKLSKLVSSGHAYRQAGHAYRQAGEIFSNISSYEIGFLIGPRINAAGRLDHANTAFELLITDNEQEVETIARHLEETNFQRKKIIEDITKEVECHLQEIYRGNLPNIILEGSTEWPVGVIGLVAGRITEKYSRPTFIYSRDEIKGESKGSCRSIKTFNLVEAMKNCGDVPVDFGGHALAAGFTVKNENIEKFRECLLKQAENLKEEDLRPTLNIDGEIEFQDVDWDVYDWLKKFEPHGKENEKPVFLMKNLKAKNVKWVGNGGNHLQLWLTDAGAKPALKILRGVAFRFNDFKDKIKTGDAVDVVFELDVNEWNGNRELQLMIKDLKVV